MFLLALPVFVPFFLISHKKNLEDVKFKPRFNSLYLNVNTNMRMAIFASTLFLVRRLIFGLSIVFLEGYSSI